MEGGGAATVCIEDQIITAPAIAEPPILRIDGTTRLEIASGTEALLEAAGFRTFEDLVDPKIGTLIAGSRSGSVRRVPSGSTALFVKCFTYPTVKDAILRIVSRRFRRHRARREWLSIELQERLGLPVVARVCIGERRQRLLLRTTVLVTEELSGARGLDEWLQDPEGERESTDLPAIVAGYVALLHRNGFVHGDLNARNVLIRRAGVGLDLRNVDSAHGRHVTWNRQLTRCHLRDLAPLALAFRVIDGAGAEAELVLAYASEMGTLVTPRVARMLQQEIARISKKEERRLR